MKLSTKYIKIAQINLRRPINLPIDEEVKMLRDYLVSEITKMVSNTFKFWDCNSFCTLRDLTATRLTLYNSRRGGEPARMMIEQWSEAKSDGWLQSSYKMDLLYQKLFKDVKVTYQSGKGKHLVPVLFPKDVHLVMDILCDRTV